MPSFLSPLFKFMIVHIFTCIFTDYITNTYIITTSQRGHLSDGLIAHLVVYCTSIAEVMGTNPGLRLILFFGLF